jgi:mutator protein MutT
MERLKTPHYQVTAAIIVSDGKILITQRQLHDAFGGLWEFPGGKQEQGESLEQCLTREIFEELAVSIQIHEHLFSITHRYEKLKISLHFFLCTILNGAPTCKEVQDWRWVEYSEMNQYQFTEADREVVERLKESNQII